MQICCGFDGNERCDDAVSPNSILCERHLQEHRKRSRSIVQKLNQSRKRKVIGITGYKHSGKDQIAKYLVSEYGFVRISFADKLREICSVMFDIPVENFLDSAKKEQIDERYGMSPRDILIHIGTTGFRAIYPTVWYDYVARTIQNNPTVDYVIPDVRFDNEFDGIASLGGTNVRVERDGCELGTDIKTSGMYHRSEDILTVENNGSIRDLNAMVDEMMKEIK